MAITLGRNRGRPADLSGVVGVCAAHTRVSPPSICSVAADAEPVLDLEAGAAEFGDAGGDLDRVAELRRFHEIGARIDQRNADDAESRVQTPAA